MKKLDNVEYIVLHCSATKSDQDIGKHEINQWHRERGWLCIGYHLVIRRDGAIEFGRPLGAQGAHVKGYNSKSVGVCMVGGIDEQGEPENNFTENQWSALSVILPGIHSLFPFSTIVGHHDLDVSKACPCFYIDDYVVQGKNKITVRCIK